LEWLLRFGQREEAHVLYPTSDEMVYLLSANRAELAKRFVLYQPDLETVMRVLDKKQLLEAAHAVGLETPETWFPENAADAERAGREADGPLMIKPRTQLFLRHHRKGAVAPHGALRLGEAYDAYVRENAYGAPIANHMPAVTRPMLQRYYPEATEWIYSLSGFRDRSGRHLAMLGAVKVLQRPRRMGVGLCFESAPVAADLPGRVAQLLERLDYYGVFELEFIPAGERLLLIDMNPRYYNQLALDIARGLDLPRLAYAAALGDDAEVSRLAGIGSGTDTDVAFCNSIGLGMLVGAQRMFGTMSTDEATRWRRWYRDKQMALVDAVAAGDDLFPLAAEAMGQLYGCLRHPRAFLRQIALDR
jgi:predicted ATP-grasp superfamily ATP-dependent carboligase